MHTMNRIPARTHASAVDGEMIGRGPLPTLPADWHDSARPVPLEAPKLAGGEIGWHPDNARCHSIGRCRFERLEGKRTVTATATPVRIPGVRLVALVLVVLFAGLPRDVLAAAEPSAYDPLAAPEIDQVQVTDFSVHDAVRTREIPIRIYLLPEAANAPVVLFSHGLGGSRENNAYLGRHWAARGYACVFLQHPGSDTSVWQDAPLGQRYGAMQDAASVENFMLRVKDVPAVLDQLGKWNAEAGQPLAGRLDLARVGMSGHSFGAVTTQAVSGQTFFRSAAAITEPRIRAAVAFSPSSPRVGRAERAFGSVAIPWMLMTGTEDTSPIGNSDVASRLAVFPALPPGSKYELVLQGAKHSAFGDRALPGERGGRNPNHHRVIIALSTAFWDAYLKEDPAARAWLDGAGPATVLEKDDRWQLK